MIILKFNKNVLIVLIFVSTFLFSFFGCTQKESVVQNRFDRNQIKVVQLPSRNGDLYVYSNKYNLNTLAEISIDLGETWSEEFILPYNQLILGETTEIWIRKKGFTTPYKTFLPSTYNVFLHKNLSLNELMPPNFDDVIITNPTTRVSQLITHLSHNQTFLLFTIYEYGFSLDCMIINNNSHTALSNPYQFALIDNTEMQNLLYESDINWKTFGEFSAFDFDLDGHYHLLWRFKETEETTASLFSSFEIIGIEMFNN